MVAVCIPKHIPRYGILFSLAYLMAINLPVIPRPPNPPGTKIPWQPLNALRKLPLSSKPSEFTHSNTTL
jgi:hypothetical protein